MDFTPSKDIVVIGGSLCGLMHGIVLKRLGHNVHILEQVQTSNRPALGAGISAGPYCQEFMAKHDRSQQPYGTTSSTAQFFNVDGVPTRHFEFPSKMASWDVLYYRLRANFDGLTSNHCSQSYADEQGEGKGLYDLGKKVINVTPAKEKLEVAFEDLASGSKSTIHADYVIAADGVSSTIRQQLFHEPHRPYAGYVAWRATVPESEVEADTISLLDGHFSIFRMRKSYMCSYIVPGANGSLQAGSRLVNYLWYYNVPEASDEFTEIMTDSDSHKYRYTLPAGKMKSSVWERQKAKGRDVPLPRAYQELLDKTTQPFITAISDTPARGAVMMNGRLFLVGDAHALFRPHVGASSNQSALNALQMEKLFRGEIDAEEFEATVTAYAKQTRALSVAIGTFFLSGWISAMPWALSFLGMLLKARLVAKLSWLGTLFRGRSKKKKHQD